MTKQKVALQMRLLRMAVILVSLLHISDGGAALGLSWDSLANGKPFAILTYMFVHGSILHLVINYFSLRSLSVWMEQKYGSTRSILLFLATGAIGGLVALFIYPLLGHGSFFIVGSSGSICGWIGYSVFDQWKENRKQTVFSVPYILVMGMVMPSSFVIHASCFIVGLLLRQGEPAA